MNTEENNDLTLPIICVTTTDGGFFGIGMPPSHGSKLEENPYFSVIANQEGANNLSEDNKPKHLVVNAIHEDPRGLIIEILTETGLTPAEIESGVRSVSMLKIPQHSVAMIKAGYIRGIPKDENASQEEE